MHYPLKEKQLTYNNTSIWHCYQTQFFIYFSSHGRKHKQEQLVYQFVKFTFYFLFLTSKKFHIVVFLQLFGLFWLVFIWT